MISEGETLYNIFTNLIKEKKLEDIEDYSLLLSLLVGGKFLKSRPNGLAVFRMLISACPLLQSISYYSDLVMVK